MAVPVLSIIYLLHILSKIVAYLWFSCSSLVIFQFYFGGCHSSCLEVGSCTDPCLNGVGHSPEAVQLPRGAEQSPHVSSPKLSSSSADSTCPKATDCCSSKTSNAHPEMPSALEGAELGPVSLVVKHKELALG